MLKKTLILPMKIDKRFGNATNVKQRMYSLKKYQVQYTARSAKKRMRNIKICWLPRIEIS